MNNKEIISIPDYLKNIRRNEKDKFQEDEQIREKSINPKYSSILKKKIEAETQRRKNEEIKKREKREKELKGERRKNWWKNIKGNNSFI